MKKDGVRQQSEGASRSLRPCLLPFLCVQEASPGFIIALQLPGQMCSAFTGLTAGG